MSPLTQKQQARATQAQHEAHRQALLERGRCSVTKGDGERCSNPVASYAPESGLCGTHFHQRGTP